MLENNQKLRSTENTEYRESFRLRAGYWILDNREFFRKLAITIFVIFDMALLTIMLIFYINYISANKKQNTIIETFAMKVTAFPSWSNREGPRDLKIEDTEYVKSANNKYDFVSLVENKNKNWYIKSLDYMFVWDGGKSEIKTIAILPNEKKYLLALNEINHSNPSRLKLDIVSIEWEWVGDEFVAEVMDKNKIEAVRTELFSGSGIVLDRTEYVIKNNTIYNLWNVNFNIVLYQGSKIVGLNRGFIEKFYADETRLTENVWIQKLPSGSRIVVDPEINFLDRDSYIPTPTTGEIK